MRTMHGWLLWGTSLLFQFPFPDFPTCLLFVFGLGWVFCCCFLDFFSGGGVLASLHKGFWGDFCLFVCFYYLFRCDFMGGFFRFFSEGFLS